MTPTTREKLKEKINSETWKEFRNEVRMFLEEWQYDEPYSLEYQDRFELDKEAFINYYFSPNYDGANEYNEVELIDRLINNLSKCKHPYWTGYLNYLEPLKGSESVQKQAEGSTSQINTFCKKMPLNIPKEHFKVMVEKMNKNNQPFLTNGQYSLFIERAFCGKTEIQKQKINQAPKGEKLLIQALFFDFYDNYCFDYFQTMQCQDIFIKLLTDNFIGWDFKNVKDNFKPKTKKRL